MVGIIWQKQKLILIAAIAFLALVFISGKSIPIVYGQFTGRGLDYSKDGYFVADNGVFGGPGEGGTGVHSAPGCGNCLSGFWRTHCSGSGKSRRCWRVWHCTLRRDGIQGFFTPDSACKAAYGSSVTANFGYLRISSAQINICDYNTSNAYRVECIPSTTSVPARASPPSSPCAEWKNGTCLKVDTSISKGGINKVILSVNPEEFIIRIFIIILNFAGGITLLLIISAGYKLIMSKGKPEAIQQGRDQLVSAIVGLIFIIFSFFVFQLIFVDILKIPGIM